MKSLTVTAFKKLSLDDVQKQVPIAVTSSGKPVYNVVSQATQSTPDRSYLVKLVLVARNDNGTDPAHVQSAGEVVDRFLGNNMSMPSSTTTTATAQPVKSLDISKAYWLGEWSGNVKDFVTGVYNDVKDGTALFVCYNIPGRDNGNYSAGGLHSAAEYGDWINSVAAGIGSKKAIVILEPDALGLSASLNTQQQTERFIMLQKAVDTLKMNKNTKVYIDSSIWSGVINSIGMLNKFKNIDGFSCNVSGYVGLKDCNDYAQGVASGTNLHYVVDTSRNGNGAPHGADKWCNQTDTTIGMPNQLNPINNCDAYLWVKPYDESDGLGINDDGSHPRTDVPSAGTKWTELGEARLTGDWSAFKIKYNV